MPAASTDGDDDTGATDRAWEATRLEYEQLRSEIDESIRNQARILGYGGTALSLLLGLGLTQHSLVLLVSVPFISFFFLVLWNVEQTRMMRIGDYVSFVEHRLNDETFGAPVVLWENWLRYRSERPGRDIYQYHYIAQYLVLFGFLVVQVVSLAGLWLWRPASLPVWLLGSLSLVYAVFLVAAVYLLRETIRHEGQLDSFKSFYRRKAEDYGSPEE